MQNEKTIYYRDVALIRYRKPPDSVQVVNETGFMNTFQRRQNDPYWNTIHMIQTNIKSKTGCGKPFIIKFYAPLDPEDPEGEVDFDYKSVGDDEDLLSDEEFHLYCLK